MRKMLADVVRVISVSMLPLAIAPRAEAADHGQLGSTSPEVKDWANSLENKSREACCSAADGWKPQEVEYDIKESRYRVKIDGEWYDVPPDAVLQVPNRFGFAVVWYYQTWLDGIRPSISIRCFIPGAGG
jgi:hypothetical protein